MEILGKLLGNPARVKIMRLFLLNKEDSFKAADIVKRSRVTAVMVRRELRLLYSVGFIKKRMNDFYFNPAFKYRQGMEDLLVNSDSLEKETILNMFKKAGKLKFVVVAGIFIKNKDTRVDLLVVGDKLKRGKIEEGIHKIEAEIGYELTYAIFETKEFLYRVSMYDKLVRDIIDFPHEVVLQTKELSTQSLKKA